MSLDGAEFEELEDEFDLFDLRFDEIPIWERVRFGVFRAINEQMGVGKAGSDVGDSVSDHLKGLSAWLKNWFRRNPFLASPANVMFVGSPRRKKGEDGLWWDIYCDPIHEAHDMDYVHFEIPRLLEHKRPAKTKVLRYLDLIHYGGALQRKLGAHRVFLPSHIAKRLDGLERTISDRFDVTVNVHERVIGDLRSRRSTLWLYERLVRKVDPEVAVIICSYGNETIIEAFQRNSVPVIELQHGVIHRNHLGYHYPGHRTKETFPDYLLTWGEYWNNCVDYPIDGDHVISTGYPYLELEREKHDDVDQRDQLLFISQGAIGPELSKFAVEFSERDLNAELVYKLHPGEYDRWEEDYPWLTDADLHVVDDESVPLYRLFAESAVQIGVFSTAILEGLSFDLETYLVDIPGVEALSYLFEQGYATVVGSPRELRDVLEQEAATSQVNTEPFFANDALSNTIDAIQDISARTVE